MRVCLFTPNFLPSLGGAERMADTIVRGLCARGHEVFVLAQRSGDDAADAQTDAGLPYPVRRYRRPPAQHLWPGVLGRAVVAAHRAWGFEAVLSFYGYPTGFAASRVKKKLGVRLVVSPRGGDLYPNFHALRKPGVRRAIAAGYCDADRIASISAWLTERIEEVTGLGREALPPIDAVPNGIDLAAFDAELASAERGDLPVEPPFLLHLARLHEVKRHDLAVDAVAAVAEQFRTRKMRYAIVGDGAAAAGIQKHITERGVGDVVVMLGRRTGTQKAWLLRHAAALVTTSREEGMPNTVLEAMAAGLPVVASDIGPHRELIAGHGWGALFRAGDADDLAAELRGFLEADPEPMRIAALRLREQYTLERTIDGYERSLRAALGV